MMYPRRTPKQAKEAEEAKKLATLQQREQLLLLASQKFPDRFAMKPSEAKSDHYASEGRKTLSSEKLKGVHHNVEHNRHNEDECQESDRGDISMRSDHSKMSGATDHSEPEELNNTEIKKDGLVIDLMLSTKSPAKKAYKNEEEQWAEIYKANHEAYEGELHLKKERKEFDKKKFRDELDRQVSINDDKREKERALRRMDHEQVMKRVEKDDQKETKKKELEKAKSLSSKQMREDQIKVNKSQKKLDQKEQRALDKYIIDRIREEQMELERATKKKRQEDEVNYRRALAEHDEKRQLILEAKERERQAEIRQIAYHHKLIEQREQARADAFKAKDERIRRTIELAREQIMKPQDEKEQKIEFNLKKWNDQREEEDRQAALEARLYASEKRIEHKAFLEQQIIEAKQRKFVEKNRRNDQLELWRVSNQKKDEWEQARQTEKNEQKKYYSEVLGKQLQERIEERKVTDRLFNLRQSLEDNRRALVK